MGPLNSKRKGGLHSNRFSLCPAGVSHHTSVHVPPYRRLARGQESVKCEKFFSPTGLDLVSLSPVSGETITVYQPTKSQKCCTKFT